ncbi:hypothetical protein ACJJTC_012807 [Scirpophaga incertulas]
MRIAVIGCGINGLACALKIKETYQHIQVVIFSRECTPNTTGDGSGGLWLPYICGETDPQLITKWGKATYKFYHELWKEGGHGVSLIPLYNFHLGTEIERPAWADVTYGYEDFNQQQIDYYNKLYNSKYRSGRRFTTFVAHAPTIMAYLTKRFKLLGGKIVQTEISNLNDPLFRKFDALVNCSGLGARDIVPDDTVFPVRGQISKVLAPWANHVIMDNTGEVYIIPNSETCVVGGTHQENDFNTKVDDRDTEKILKKCSSFLPGLKQSEIIGHWAGLRPARRRLRLEAADAAGKLWKRADSVLGLRR